LFHKLFHHDVITSRDYVAVTMVTNDQLGTDKVGKSVGLLYFLSQHVTLFTWIIQKASFKGHMLWTSQTEMFI